MDFLKKHAYRFTAGISALACIALAIIVQPEATSKETQKPTINADAAPVEKVPALPKKIGTAQVHGWLETASISAVGDRARAKLDTGAKTSSINAEIVKIFKRDDNEYVLFRVDLDTKHEVTLERKIVRWAKIKSKKGKPIKRPVVIMSVCIGNQILKGETNLADRDHFNYPILIGRNMLSTRVIVDVSRTFTVRPTCDIK